MFLIHDDDLRMIDGLGDGTVSRYLTSGCSFLIPRQSLEALQPDVVMDLLRRSNIEIHSGEFPAFTESMT